MPDLLSLIWERADAREPRFSGDEVGAWPDAAAARLTGRGLIRPVENALSVPCDACAAGHVEEVIFVQSPPGSAVRAYILCSENGRVRVPLDRLKQWEVDFHGLASAVARALELAGDLEEVAPGRVWFLGKATLALESREVFLARGLMWEDGREVLGASARLNAARSSLVLVAGEPPPVGVWNGDAPPVVALKIVAGLGKKGLTVDRGHLESRLSTGRKRSPATPLVSFPTPAGTTWPEVRLVLMENALRIEAKGKRRDYTFQEAGFEERRRKGVPDRLWRLLGLFAVHGGVLPFKAVGAKARRNLRQYISDLRDRITALMPSIDGDPIAYDKDERAYRAAFRISTEEGLRFPTPPGATWAEVSIAGDGASGIRVSVTSRERFAASGFTGADPGDTRRWEAAEQEASKGRRYDLRSLALADDQGRANPAGQALLGVLAGKGTVKRKADDKGMVALCGALSRLMGMEGSPFEFAPFEETWVALFDVPDGAPPSR